MSRSTFAAIVCSGSVTCLVLLLQAPTRDSRTSPKPPGNADGLSPRQPAKEVKIKPSVYRFDSSGHKWLRGVVSRDPATNLWRLTYAVAPKLDRYGGSLPLVGDEEELNSLTTGDVIVADGDVISAEAGVQLGGNTKSIIEMYRVSRVTVLKGKAD